MQSVLETRPMYHQLDDTIRGHIFCSFLALVPRKELDRRLEKAGLSFACADIKQDLKALQDITVDDTGKKLAIRSQCLGSCGKVFQAWAWQYPRRCGKCRDSIRFSKSKHQVWCQELFGDTYVHHMEALFFCRC